MRAYILNGGQKEKNAYLDAFINRNGIPAYNIISYTEPLKIAEAKEIKRKLSISSNTKRLVVLASTPTIEAQNALLKLLEELPDDTDVIFFDGSALLPTVVSRCSIVNLNKEGKEENEASTDLFKNFVGEHASFNASSVFTFVDELLKEDPSILSVQSLLRDSMKFYIVKNDLDKTLLTQKLLKKVVEKTHLTNNNLNKKIFLENLFLSILIN